jgi:hypothetical protein
MDEYPTVNIVTASNQVYMGIIMDVWHGVASLRLRYHL